MIDYWRPWWSQLQAPRHGTNREALIKVRRGEPSFLPALPILHPAHGRRLRGQDSGVVDGSLESGPTSHCLCPMSLPLFGLFRGGTPSLRLSPRVQGTNARESLPIRDCRMEDALPFPTISQYPIPRLARESSRRYEAITAGL